MKRITLYKLSHAVRIQYISFLKNSIRAYAYVYYTDE